MIKRYHLDFQTNSFVVSFEGDGPQLQPQPLRMTIASAIRGRSRETIVKDVEGIPEELKGSAIEILQPEFPGERPSWDRFMLVRNEDGTLRGCSIRYTSQMWLLLNECGFELAQIELKEGNEPEIVALCGGLENALSVLEHCYQQSQG